MELLDIVTTPMSVYGATAYHPLPTEPLEERCWFRPVAGDPRPAPQPSPSPGGPAYPPLPTEIDTRDGKPGGRK